MAVKTWINRVSNLVRRMIALYGAACAGAIATVAISVSLWATQATAASERVVCVLVPHFKDEYWLSVGYGIEQEAARQDVALLFFEAGGYRASRQQIEQLGTCVARGADAILIGAVASDHPELIDTIARIAPEIPVVGLVNALHSDALSAHVGVDWRQMGRSVGDYLAQRHPAGSAPQTAILVSGPSEAGWTAPLEAGLREGLAGAAVSIVAVSQADTGLRQQLAQVEEALGRYPDADYLIGSAPAIEAAMGLLSVEGARAGPLLLSTYISHTVLRGLLNGSVLAVPFDAPMEQGMLAIRQAVEVPDASRMARRATGPEITLLTPDKSGLAQLRLSPADYFPVIQ